MKLIIFVSALTWVACKHDNRTNRTRASQPQSTVSPTPAPQTPAAPPPAASDASPQAFEKGACDGYIASVTQACEPNNEREGYTAFFGTCISGDVYGYPEDYTGTKEVAEYVGHYAAACPPTLECEGSADGAYMNSKGTGGGANGTPFTTLENCEKAKAKILHDLQK
jgi:hypothetical protein